MGRVTDTGRNTDKKKCRLVSFICFKSDFIFTFVRTTKALTWLGLVFKQKVGHLHKLNLSEQCILKGNNFELAGGVSSRLKPLRMLSTVTLQRDS